MSKLHFRTPREPRAGNFIPGVGWYTLIDMFRTQLVTDIEQAISDEDLTISVTYDADKLIGWSSTVESETFLHRETEKFHLNRRATGIRFKLNAGQPAPLTTEVTFVMSIKPSENKAFIQSMYPGRDVGKLESYVSAREHVIFFDFDHIGETLV